MATEKYTLNASAVPKAETCLAEATRIVSLQPPFGEWRTLHSEARVAYAIAVSAVFEKLMDRG